MWRTDHAFGVDVPMRLDTVVDQLIGSFRSQGFLVHVSQMEAAMPHSSGAAHQRFRVLTLLDPAEARSVLEAGGDDFGLIFPIRMIIYESFNHLTRVVVTDPEKVCQTAGTAYLRPMAHAVGLKLAKVLFEWTRPTSIEHQVA